MQESNKHKIFGGLVYIYLGTIMVMISTLMIYSCANLIAPQGGPKDTRAPVLDTANSSRNYQTRFDAQEISLTFDEWIVLRDAFTQVVISPPPAKLPDIRERGKTVFVTFDEEEELLANTTYTINFGSAIRDLTEGNTIENFKYVFSTGEYIDSLSISGTVINANDLTPAAEVLVMLYDNLEDSTIYKERPVYFAKTAENGSFRIDNIREDSFALKILKDGNLNYLYDQESEGIGFLDTTFYLFDPTSVKNFQLQIFEQTINPTVLEAFHYCNGYIKIACDKTVDEYVLGIDEEPGYAYHFADDDTIRLFYSDPVSDSIFIHAIFDEISSDTFHVQVAGSGISLENEILDVQLHNASKGRKKHPREDFILTMEHPVSSVDSTLLTILENDTIPFEATGFSIDSADERKVIIQADWKEGSFYLVNSLPGSINNYLDQTHDTIRIRFRNEEVKNYGNININVTGLDSTLSYVFLLKNGGEVIGKEVLIDQNSHKVSFSLLPPATYTAVLIEDLDRNQKWTSGDYNTRRQPEKIMLKTLEELRASWDIEAEFPWNK